MKPRLCIVVTVPMSLATLLEGQPRFLSEHFDVSLVCGPDEGGFVDRVREQEGVVPHTIPLTRRITPGRDLRALAELTGYFRRTRPDIVQTYTPKAGLVGMAAARLARVPIRVHGVVGMPLMEATGRRAALLAAAERATYANATDLTCNSTGLRDWIHANLTRRPITVVGHGSINGVDTERFADTWDAASKAALRSELGIPDGAVVFLFVGRVVRDKGIEELLEAFTRVADDHPQARLLLVGDYEPELDPISPRADEVVRSHPGVVKTGFVRDVRPYIALSDVFVLPSYREGLPNSLIEAGSMGRPAIATDINGCNEVIVPGENGLLVPPKDAGSLESAMRLLIEDPGTREALRAGSRPSVIARFAQQESFWPELLALYERLLARA